MDPPVTQRTVDVGEVISSLVAAAAAAARVIRRVQAARVTQGSSALRASMKDEHDPNSYLTVADVNAQAVMLRRLESDFPGVRVVAEEGPEPDLIQRDLLDSGGPCRPAHTEAAHPMQKLQVPEGLRNVLVDDVCIFLDPVDATREFVEGRLEPVQVLAGVAVRGLPVAGVVAIPFQNQDGSPYHCPWDGSGTGAADTVRIIYGAVGAGVVGLLGECLPPADASHGTVIACSSGCDRDTFFGKIMRSPGLQPHVKLSCAGCGNKALAVLEGRAHLAFYNLGSSLWDTCAIEALVCARGGCVTDLFGCRIRHTHEAETANRRGVVISSREFVGGPGSNRHRAVCHELMHCGLLDCLVDETGIQRRPDEAQAIDVARDDSGRQLTCSVIGELLGCPGWVQGYSIPESSCVRYKQSDAARVLLSYREEDSSPEDRCRQPKPESVFIKRIVLRDLPYAAYKAVHAPGKLFRDVKSTRIEASFLQSAAAQSLAQKACSGGPELALPYAVMSRPFPEESPMDAAYVVFLRDFSPALGWKQHPFLDEHHMKAVLKALAFFHAHFWRSSRDVSSDRPPEDTSASFPEVWDSGCYWHLGQQQQSHLDRVASEWPSQLEALQPAMVKAGLDPSTVQAQYVDLGSRLRDIAEEVHSELHLVEPVRASAQRLGHTAVSANHSSAPFLTLIHGDPKAANFFFSSPDPDAKEPAGPTRSPVRRAAPAGPDVCKVGMVDFQWTGWGVAGVDLAYCIAASASPELLSLDGLAEKELLRFYYDALAACLTGSQQPGATVCSDLPEFSVLVHQYEAGLVDLTRAVIADQWPGISLEKLESRQHHKSFNAYNKSILHAVWLTHRSASIVHSYDQR